MNFIALSYDNENEIAEMSALASSIVKEHFDPIIGSEQNDYMIEKFQSVSSIKQQLYDGYKYYFVCLDYNKIGFLAYRIDENSLYLSKFYLDKAYRGKGFSRDMFDFIKNAAIEKSVKKITLNVNKNNDAVYAYEKLGFKRTAAQKKDIGNGFFMDDYIYEYTVSEKTEPLGNGMKIIVSDEYKLWTDTVLLADFSAPKKKDNACELGSGCGAIPLIWFRNDSVNHVTAVEIQEEACSLLERSIRLNNLDGKINVVNSDLRDLNGKLKAGAYDLVVCNPPYKAEGTGIKSKNSAQIIARHESMCNVDDIICAASKLLNFSGRLCMCQRPERLSDLICTMRKYSIEPKRLRFVQQRMSKAPKLFLIEGKKGGKPGGLIVEPVLFIENEKGDFSKEMLDIYGAYKEEYM